MSSGSSSQSSRRLRVLCVVAMSFVLFASGCAANNDPADWAEAEADGTLEENFMRSCRTANEGGGLDASEAASYCECSFKGLRQHYADDFDGFKDAEKRLRSDPEDIDQSIRTLLVSCRTQ